jgi:hypothetical protein
MRTRNTLILSSLVLLVLLGACNLPGKQAEPENTVATWVASTLTAMSASAPSLASTPTPAANATETSIPLNTDTPQPSSTPQNPLVLDTNLCWKGPGSQYEVVSALKKDERVELIGQGSIAGWWIVNNPIYHDPCWAQAEYLKIDLGYNTASLPIYTPPPSPTPTPTDTRTPTVTPTATNTP